MEDLPKEMSNACEGEILPPDQENRCGGPAACVCCGWPQSFLDPDGCGLCEECLAS